MLVHNKVLGNVDIQYLLIFVNVNTCSSLLVHVN